MGKDIHQRKTSGSKNMKVLLLNLQSRTSMSSSYVAQWNKNRFHFQGGPPKLFSVEWRALSSKGSVFSTLNLHLLKSSTLALAMQQTSSNPFVRLFSLSSNVLCVLIERMDIVVAADRKRKELLIHPTNNVATQGAEFLMFPEVGSKPLPIENLNLCSIHAFN